MAQLVGDAYIRIFGDASAVRRAIKREEAKIAAAGEDAADSYLTNFGKTIQQRADARLRQAQLSLADAIAGKDFSGMLKRSGMEVDEFVRNISLDLKRFKDAGYFPQMTADVDEYREALDTLNEWAGQNKLVAEQERITAAVKRNTIATRQGFAAWRVYNRETRIAQGFANEHEVTMRRWSNSVSRTNILLARHADATGRMFGAGSRSEFLNFFGRLIGHMSRLPALAISGFGKMVEFGADMIEQFHDLRDASGGTFKGISGLGSAFATLGSRLLVAVLPGIAAFLIGIGAMTVLMPALISLLASLVGAVVAVAGAITVALVGGILALLPLLAAGAIGIGGIAVAIAGWGDANDRVKKKIQAVTDAWKTLTRTLGTRLITALSTSANGLSKIIAGWTPMLTEIVAQVGYMVERFVALFTHPAMQPFIDAWEKSLPRIFGSIGDGLISLGGALTAFFKPILPYAERLAAAFDNAMRTFLDWSISAEGQNSIAEFMERAWEMGEKLWGIIKNIGSIIWSVFNAGAEGPGGDFLGWLQQVTEDFSAFLKTPEGQTAVTDFFTDVKDTMVKIKEIFGVISQKMSEIDWDQAAEDVQTVLDAVIGIITVFGAIWTMIAGVVSVMRATWDEEWAAMEERWASISTFFQSLPGAITVALLSIPVVIMLPFQIAWNALTGFLGGFNITGLIARLPAQVQSGLAALPFSMTNPFTIAAGAVRVALGLLAANVGTIIARIPGIVAAGLAMIVSRFTLPFQLAGDAVRVRLAMLGINIMLIVSQIPGVVGRALSGLAARFVAPVIDAYNRVSDWVDNIRGLFSGLISFASGIASSISGMLSSSGAAIAGATGTAGSAPRFGPAGAVSQPSAGPTGMRGASNLSDALTIRGLSNFTLPTLPEQSQGTRAERVINFHPGSIVVSSQSREPAIVAAEVVDRIAARVSYV